MGNFYANIVLRGPETAALVAAVASAGMNAYVSPRLFGDSVVFVEDGAPGLRIEDAVEMLSRALSCAAIGFRNHDDDVLWYWCYRDGALVDEFDSHPGWGEGMCSACSDSVDLGDSKPESYEAKALAGDAQAVARAFGVQRRAAKVQAALDGKPACAVEIHEALLAALGLPKASAGMGYEYLERGETPDGCTRDQIVLVRDGKAGKPL